MGCDIHLHIELKISGKWEHYGAPHVTRWYRLFGLLAGVRDKEITPISQPKGLPDDITIITKMSRDTMGRDGHTDSWLNRDEICQLHDTLQSWGKEENKFFEYDLEHSILNTYLFRNGFCDLCGSQKPEELEDVRFIFWFDN